ncbi:hypothetical protein [Streptomyces sp. NPDC018833]|uniref:hypothetical protein n=1 Tax=Streptomyces sp. NPDC018833 TaxID=3365053 RepID=UPI0037B2F8C1
MVPTTAELIALLCLIMLATVVYATAGPEAFAPVTGVGEGESAEVCSRPGADGRDGEGHTMG